MDTPPSSSSLADRAMAKLRRVAAGNGIDPATLVLVEANETIYDLEAALDLSPLCDTRSTSHPGGPRGKDRKILPNGKALQAAVAQHQQQFRARPDWAAEAIRELKAHDKSAASGWGMDQVKVTLPSHSAIYAASDPCPRCLGQKLLQCPECHGRRVTRCIRCEGTMRERCYNCHGTGMNPHQK